MKNARRNARVYLGNIGNLFACLRKLMRGTGPDLTDARP